MKVWDPSALGLQVTKVNGMEAKMKCPFHLDNTPSAMFNLESGLFHCFGCGHSANAYQLAKEFGGELSKIDFDLIPHYDTDEREWLNLSYSRSAVKNKYLARRKVTVAQIEKFKIMSHKEGVLFPIYNQRRTLVGIQERRYSLEPKYMLHGERTAVWPLENLRYEKLLLVEGVFGVLRANLFGYNAVCTMGASAIPQAAKILEGHDVRIVFDDDLAGYLGAYMFMKLHRNSCVILPGEEVDEADLSTFERIMTYPPTRDIMGYAMKTMNKSLVSALHVKEKQYEKKNRNKRFSRSRVSR